MDSVPMVELTEGAIDIFNQHYVIGVAIAAAAPDLRTHVPGRLSQVAV